MPDRDREPRPKDCAGWIFIRGPELPPGWRDRAVEAWLLPLTPAEMSAVLEESTLRPSLSNGDARIASLLASGLSPRGIASRTGLSVRTIHRRLAKLRDRIGTSSTAELALLLARRGF